MRRIRVKWLSPILLLMLFGITGCGSIRHIVHQPGETGVITQDSKVTVAMPDKDGALVEGAATLPAGTLIRIPKGREELIDTLKAAGVKVNGQ